MRPTGKSVITGLLALALLPTVAWGAMPPSLGQLPADWYQWPEDGLRMGASSESFSAMAWGLLNRSLERIFQADATALERVGALSADYPSLRAGASSPPGGHRRWRVSALEFYFGVTAEGIFAPLSLRGTVQLGVIFHRRKSVSPPASTKPESTPVIRFTGPGRDDVARQLEPMIRKAIASGQVSDEAALRRHLSERVDAFQELATVLDRDWGTRWFASRFRLELWVSVSGMVSPSVMAGATLRLRFEWQRLMHRGNLPVKGARQVASASPPDGLSPIQEKFLRFVRALAEDIDVQDYRAMEKLDYHPRAVFLGLGLTAGGDFGVVKVDGGVAGSLTFSYDAQLPPPIGRPGRAPGPAKEPFYLIESHPTRQHLRYARARGIPFTLESSRDGAIDNVIYKLNHWAFRRGLKRAAKMSTWLAERAARTRSDKWEISALMPFFSLGIGADLKFVSIGGYGAVGFVFYNGAACTKGEKTACES